MSRNLIITQRQAPDRHGSPTDSLENAYVDCFSALGFNIIPIPNKTPDPASFMANLAPLGLVLSGGGDISPSLYGGQPLSGQLLSPERDRLEFSLLDFAVKKKIPVLGICRGMQMINVFFGGGLDSMILSATHDPKDVIAPHNILFEDEVLQGQFSDGCEVNSYHRQAVPLDQLGRGIVAFARHGTMLLAEGIRHIELPIAGIQWHPERSRSMKPVDQLLLKAFSSKQLFWGV
jgi:putative glutamine amidotransferase